MKLQALYDIIYPIICNYCHCYYDVDEYVNLNELEDQLSNNDFIIDKEFVNSIINSLNSIDNLSKLKYSIESEDYYLDASESIYIENLIIYDEHNVELYKLAMDEFYHYHSISLFIRVLLYVYKSIELRSKINKFLPYNYFDK